MASPNTSPRLSFAQRILGRSSSCPVVDEESKMDEKAESIEYMSEMDSDLGLQSDEAYAFMASHTFRSFVGKRWVKQSEHNGLVDAVAIRQSKRNYTVYPQTESSSEFYHSINALNCEIAVTVSADWVAVITNTIPAGAEQFSLNEHDHIQVVDTMQELAFARSPQHGCFIRDEKRLVVWADRIGQLEETVQEFESKLVSYVFHRTLRRTSNRMSMSSNFTASSLTSSPSSPSMSPGPSRSPSTAFLHQSMLPIKEKEEKPFDGGNEATAGLPAVAARRLPLNHSVYTGLAISLNIVLCTLLARSLMIEALYNKEYRNLGILAVIPFLFCVIMFFAETIISIFAQILAPVGVLGENSLYFSSIPPVRNLTGPLPHVSIIMPVYKESLDEVLAPTIESCSEAIRTYELQGGTASIIVCEDGMQLVDAEEVEKRKEYYDKWSCAFVARPKENRAGRFKKSSNMNTTMGLSLRVEELMDERRPTDLDDLAAWTAADEERLYQGALDSALLEGDNVLWANGNIRIGEFILIIDSDTRVPKDCLLDGATEMRQCPEVGVLQHASGTFLAGAGYFENFIAFFTTCVNHSISFCVANGATAPFVGHNAFLRWPALQLQAVDNPDGKPWSESHVSEDFVMTLCLNRAGYITRWATYSHGGFKEGVSLTCDDELNRWQKYAFGCSEMVFNPIKTWFTRGPFSPLFIAYLRGATPLPTKISSAAYVASYWAIACAPPLTLVYYILMGFWSTELSAAFQPSFGIFLSVLVVFTGGGTLATISSRYRSQSASLRTAFKEGVCNVPLSVIFFSGLAFHVFTALMAHITSYDMTWGATKKDLETPTITEELPVVWKRHWMTWGLAGLCIAGIAVLATPAVPIEWRVTDLPVMFPFLWLLCGHFLFPLLLNPAIMLFRF